MKQSFVLFLLLLLPLGSLNAQEQEDNEPTSLSAMGLFPKAPVDELYNFGVSGYYRFFSTYLNMDQPYLLDGNSNTTTLPKTLFIGDDAQLPNLSINFSGRPNSKTSWGFDLFMFQFLDGSIGSAYSQQVADAARPTIYDPLAGTRLGGNLGIQLGINMYGSHSTNFGDFNVRVGGIHWVSLSDLTLAANIGYQRYTLFERNPWGPLSNKMDKRYEDYYSSGTINQDARWGERAFTGIILDGVKLPHDLSFSVLYGKTELNGGFLTIPNLSYGGKLKKQFKGGHHVSLNTFNNTTYTDSLNISKVGFNILTTEFKTAFKGIGLSGEIGMGRYIHPFETTNWGEAIKLKIKLPKKSTFLPIDLDFFRIGEEVINNNATFWNTSIVEVQTQQATTSQSADVLRPFSSSIVAIGQMTNNRQGVSLNTHLDVGKVKVILGVASSGEIQAVSNTLTFGHRINQFSRSRLWRWQFPANVGPYNRYSVIYRDTYETVNLTDDLFGEVVHKKYFNNLEVQLKYKPKLFNRDLYIFFLGNYVSAQREWSPILVTTEEAYIRSYTSELEAYYSLTSKFTINGYVGYERILGNYNTDLDGISGRPRNQEGQGYGLGFDLSLGKRTGLFLRHRWLRFEDTSFELDKLRGQETSLELKIFF